MYSNPMPGNNMPKIIFRFLILCIFFTVLIAFFTSYVFQKIDESDVFENVKENTLVKFLYLDNHLKNLPVQEWQNAINEIQPPGASLVKVVAINNLSLNEDQISKLKRHELVYFYTKAKGYFPAVIYRRINNTEYAYQEFMDFSDAEKGRRFFGWPPAIIIKELKSMPVNLWPNSLARLSAEFGLPLSIDELKNLALTTQQKEQLLTDKWFFDVQATYHGIIMKHIGGNSEVIYVPISNDKILIIGPIKSNFVGAYSKFILFSSALVAIIFIMLLLSFLFFRSLKKLNELANDFGQGKFDSPTKISNNSVLYSLFSNLKIMGSRLKNLIYSHKELTNSISHELRTPISRLHFSLELLKEDNANSKILSRITAMEEDVTELDELVSEILDYAQLDRMDRKTELKKYEMHELLRMAINKFKSVDLQKRIIVDIQTNKPIFIVANKKYILRALQNLLQNAYRFAQSKIRISFKEVGLSTWKLTIEDDGPGILPEDRERSFEPFVQLKQQPINYSKGYGLGLAITKKILEYHQWNIVLDESELGGLKVAIEIPVI